MNVDQSLTSLQAGKIACEASGWSLTYLQLQRILYIAHMIYLGQNNQPLVRASFQACDYGPMLPLLYQRTKIYGAKPIHNIFNDIDIKFIEEESSRRKEILKAVEKLQSVSPAALISYTHFSGGGWDKNYQIGKFIPIPQTDTINDYHQRFKERNK